MPRFTVLIPILLLGISATAHAAPPPSDASSAPPSSADSPAPAVSAAPVASTASRFGFYGGITGELGFDPDLRVSYAAELGFRPWRQPLWIRAKVARGEVHLDDASLVPWDAALGVEGQRCWRNEWLCLFAGADAGLAYVTGTVNSPELDDTLPYQETQPWIAPRAGVEAGGHISVRLALQVRTAWSREIIDGGDGGLGLSLSVLGRL